MFPPTSCQRTPRPAFTLVELLVAVSIIGILMAIAIPAIGGALRRAREGAIRAEIEAIGQGIEAYKLKYGDYPPDFFSWDIAQRHYRKIFPQINNDQLLLLRRLCADTDDLSASLWPNVGHDPRRIDRAEAVVWNLGGFSSDPQFPFTGAGGPLSPREPMPVPGDLSDPANYYYNSSRDNALMDFDASLLTIGEFDPTTGTALSTEELGHPGTPALWELPDFFPCYLRRSDDGPYVYFDSRSYGNVYEDTIGTPSSKIYLNTYTSPQSKEWGSVRPYLSSQVVSPAEQVVQLSPAGSGGLRFMEPGKFQIMNGGLDNSLGQLLVDSSVSPAQPLFFSYPSGQAYRIDSSTTPATAYPTTITKFQETNVSNITDNVHLDNFANFATDKLESELE
ncbi:MAG: type II secretion system protein [Planctomycetaceae bacterium]